MHQINTMYATNMYPTERIIVEVVSTFLCFILVWFMTRPYKLTREGKYLGLPLGFGFLGISFAFAALTYSPLALGLNPKLMWFALLTRTFAFVFLATTYFFSNKKSKNSLMVGEITISLLIIALAALLLFVFVIPQFTYDSYSQSNVYLRIFNVICLSYIAIYTLRSHVRNPDPTTIWIPFGFIFLAISQYSLLFWYIDSSFSAFIGSLVARFVGLAIFLLVAYRTFYSSNKKDE
jgi:hypothetical protein